MYTIINALNVVSDLLLVFGKSCYFELATNTFQDAPRFISQQIVFPKEDYRVEAWVQ